jgi:hypothetical protein
MAATKRRHALLVELPSGAVGAVVFSTSEEARAWDQEHEYDFEAVGNVPVFTQAEILRLFKGAQS